MSKPTIHFAYTVPLGKTLIKRALDKAIRIAHIVPFHRFALDSLISWQKPIRSPHCISYNLLHQFKKKYPVRFYNMLEKIAAPLKDGDIFIGQPIPEGGFNETRPQTDEKDSITSRTIREYPNNKSFLIMPYTHDPLYVSWTKDLLRDFKGGLILVGGKIWEHNWERSPFFDISINKKIHVEMGIDVNDYPVIKKRFNPKGKRKYLYVGHTAWYKNTKELENIAKAMPEYEFGHIGGGTVAGWKKIAEFASLTPEFMSKIAEEYDIFVNTSTGDAQATTVLEQMCFGFVVACTPETGYDHDSLIFLDTKDTAMNVRILKDLQERDADYLTSIAKRNRENAEKYHSWDRFTERIIKFMEI